MNLIEIAGYIFTALGMWFFMKKCGINPKYIFIPGYRFYKLGEYVDMDEEGVTLMNALIATEVIMWGNYLQSLITKSAHVRTTYVLAAVGVMFGMAVIVYKFRIAMELCRRMTIKHRVLWSLLFSTATWIPLLVWGFRQKYQLERKEDTLEAAAEISDHEQEILKKGLTINLKERSVKAHMKKRYLLRDIHMNITPNKMVLLLGGSGAGKTTFLNAITGYEQANAVINLNGDDVYKNFNKMKYQIGFVPQQDLVRYEDTVEKTLLDAATLRLPTECTRKEKLERVKEVLEIFGLTPVRSNLVAKQSGGQKKRISIATEFIADPSLFILDEPDSGLDGILARELMRRLHEISRQEKIVIVITHTPDRVIDLFDEVIVLGKDANRTGRLVFHGSIEDAREFFQVDKMEEIVRKINCVDEGGEGMTDELIEKFEGVRHGK